jgi:hypothetical protein
MPTMRGNRTRTMLWALAAVVVVAIVVVVVLLVTGAI